MALVKIALAGEGGQGVQSVAEIIAEAAYNEKKQTLYIPNLALNREVECQLLSYKLVIHV